MFSFCCLDNIQIIILKIFIFLFNYGMDTTGEKEKRTSKKNVDGRSASSHDIQRPRTGAMEKQIGMAFGFRKTAAAAKQTG